MMKFKCKCGREWGEEPEIFVKRLKLDYEYWREKGVQIPEMVLEKEMIRLEKIEQKQGFVKAICDNCQAVMVMGYFNEGKNPKEVYKPLVENGGN